MSGTSTSPPKQLSAPPVVPSLAQKIEAVENGARVICNNPTTVITKWKNWDLLYNLEIAGAIKGVETWVSTARWGKDDVILIRHLTCAPMLSVRNQQVRQEDLHAVCMALNACPLNGQEHSPESNQARAESGKIALSIVDAMVRASVLDIVDGWTAYTDKKIHEDSEGILCVAEGLNCRVLIVKCPSTGRKYGLRVPGDTKTAKEGREWTMGGSVEVEG